MTTRDWIWKNTEGLFTKIFKEDILSSIELQECLEYFVLITL